MHSYHKREARPHPHHRRPAQKYYLSITQLIRTQRSIPDEKTYNT